MTGGRGTSVLGDREEGVCSSNRRGGVACKDWVQGGGGGGRMMT